MSHQLPEVRAAPGDIERVRLGHSEVYVTRLILGCAPLAGLYAPVEGRRAEAVLGASWDEGVRAFDTAPQYGVGLSEERLGAFLADRAVGEAVVSTKVGHLLVDTDDGVQGVDLFYGVPSRRLVDDYTKDGVRRSIAASLGRLGRDRVDVALIHDPDKYAELALAESYPALKELRDEGVVGAIGVAMNHADGLTWLVERAELDCVLIAGCYSLLDVPAADRLFPACEKRGVSVLVAGVYRSGILADPRPGTHLDYAPAPSSVVEQVDRIRSVCDRYGVPLAAAALQFVLAHPAVTAVVVGAANAQEAHENAAHFRSTVPEELFEELAGSGFAPALPPGASHRTTSQPAARKEHR
ncbi:MAG: aldo/keto reductase [Acidimicrobiales bacterium]|jgi:D-threo-aldose 1-dehydrogenase